MWWSKQPTKIIRLAALLAVSLLAACGFRLQGTDNYPASMASTYIDAEDRYTPFYRDLRVALEQGGVTMAPSPINADAIIRVEKDATGQEVLTISTRNVPTEYDVFYSVSYSVWINGEEVMPSRTLTLSQDYTYDEAQVLGKKREAEIIRDALSADLVRQVRHELSRLQ
jgi:outer membrane lipopolysaccharide assembly protein LptE/RlpB